LPFYLKKETDRSFLATTSKKAEVMATCLKLFISGSAPETCRMVAAVRSWCEQMLAGDYRLDVFDVLQVPDQAKHYGVLATPAMVLESPPTRLVGDFSDLAATMEALGLAARAR
jgi:circadian clock protein KaiB